MNWETKKINNYFITVVEDQNAIIYISDQINPQDDILKWLEKNNLDNSNLKQSSSQLTKIALKQIEDYFNQKINKLDFNYCLIGTDKQIAVWNKLKDISYGQIVCYSDLANDLNQPKSFRSIATKIGQNPLPFIIPCHRVNGKDNKLRGYRFGIQMKKELQELEK